VTQIANVLACRSPIGIKVWLLLIPFAILLLVCDEARKYFIKRSLLKAT
jgi:hypothetical protein